jgi:hypothetical protein
MVIVLFFAVTERRFLNASTPLRTGEQKLDARSKSIREDYASHHKRKRHTDKSEDKAVSGTIGLFVRALVDVRLLEQCHGQPPQFGWS